MLNLDENKFSEELISTSTLSDLPDFKDLLLEAKDEMKDGEIIGPEGYDLESTMNGFEILVKMDPRMGY